MYQVSGGFTRGYFELKPLADDDTKSKQDQEASLHLLRRTTTDVGTYNPNKRFTLFPVKKWKTGQN